MSDRRSLRPFLMGLLWMGFILLQGCACSKYNITMDCTKMTGKSVDFDLVWASDDNAKEIEDKSKTQIDWFADVKKREESTHDGLMGHLDAGAKRQLDPPLPKPDKATMLYIFVDLSPYKPTNTWKKTLSKTDLESCDLTIVVDNNGVTFSPMGTANAGQGPDGESYVASNDSQDGR